LSGARTTHSLTSSLRSVPAIFPVVPLNFGTPNAAPLGQRIDFMSALRDRYVFRSTV